MTTSKSSSLALTLAGLALFVAGGAAGWLYESHKLEDRVKAVILDNPDVIPQAMEKLRARENAKQLATVEDRVFAPFPGSVLGNPNGKVTLVEFTDFACTYCRASVADVEAVLHENPDVKVVVRHLPILSPASADAARMGLAAAEQGRYAQFHLAMFAAGRPDAATIAAAAKAAGIDMARAQKVIADPRTEAELRGNVDFARQLGFEGTPSWVVGDQLLSGAVGREALSKAIAEARKGNADGSADS